MDISKKLPKKFFIQKDNKINEESDIPNKFAVGIDIESRDLQREHIGILTPSYIDTETLFDEQQQRKALVLASEKKKIKKNKPHKRKKICTVQLRKKFHLNRQPRFGFLYKDFLSIHDIWLKYIYNTIGANSMYVIHIYVYIQILYFI